MMPAVKKQMLPPKECKQIQKSKFKKCYHGGTKYCGMKKASAIYSHWENWEVQLH